MGRRRAKEASALDAAFELFAITPSWVGPIVAVLIFALVRYVAPLMFQPKPGQADVNFILRELMPLFAWVSAGGVLLAWLAAEFHKLTNRRLLDGQSGIESVRALTWREFEHLVCEAYRRKGYVAETVGSAGGDGGVDVELRGKGETILVQCKQWKVFTVGVKPVRELLGVVVSQRATRGILVTSGRYTEEATRFAKQNPQIELVDGPELAELIESVRTKPSATEADAEVDPVADRPLAVATQLRQPSPQPECPACGAAMVVRMAKKGKNMGSEFWGCPRYPACKGTRPT